MKKIAVMMYRMGCGGVERALIELLKQIDPSQYVVDLFLLDREGEFLEQVPGYVNQVLVDIPELEKELIMSMGIRPAVRHGFASGHFLGALRLLIQYIGHKLRKSDIPIYATAFEKTELPEYDIALDFHGYASATTYVMAEKMKAKKKYTWVHGESCLRDLPQFWSCLQKFDRIFCVSNDLCDQVKMRLPLCDGGKIAKFKNFIDQERIVAQGSNGPRLPVSDTDIVKLLTVGRMAYEKGYDLAIKAASVLKKQNVNFRWFFCGDGPLRPCLEKQIVECGLRECVIFLGYCENPYSLMKDCDIYIQPSRSEGYGITIVEALLLGCAVVSTDVAGAKEEITNGVNGIIVQKNENAIVEGIRQLIDQPQVLRQTKDGNTTSGNYNTDSKKMLESILF